MKKWKTLIIFVLMFFLFSCRRTPPQERDHSCIPNKEGATIIDFVGTWLAQYVTYPQVSDTLIINADGTYKQIILAELPEIDYESEWLSWRIGYNEYGVLYLYMEGFTLCGYSENYSCAPVVDGLYYDPCVTGLLDMPENEVMLLSYEGSLRFLSSSIRSWVYLQQRK